MEATINVLNLEQVKDLVGILRDALSDERVPVEVREEYKNRLNAIEWDGDDGE